MKKLLSLLMTAVCACSCLFGLGACNKEPDIGSKTKVKFYTKTFNTWADEYIDSRVDEFNKAQDEVYVDLKIFYDNELYWQAIAAGKETGTFPEIYLVSYNTLVREKEAGNIVSINKYLTEGIKSDISSNVWDLVRLGDDYYAYPWYTEPSTLFYYRSDVLAQHGYSEPPQTFAELYDLCAKIQPTLGVGRYCISLPVGQADLSWTTIGLQKNLTGGLAVSDDWMTSRIDEAGYKELAQFFYTCIKNKWAAPASLTAEGYADNAIAVAEEKAMMCYAGSWNISLLYENYPNMVDKIGLATVPTLDGDDSKCTATNGGWSYAISALSSEAKQDAAWKFINWMAADDVERSAEYFKVEHMGKVPVRTSVSNYMKTVDANVKPQWAETVTKVASHAIPEVRYSFDISYAVAKMFEDCILNTNQDFNTIYATALSDAKATIQTVMSRATYKPNPYL